MPCNRSPGDGGIPACLAVNSRYLKIVYFYCPQRSWGKVIFSQVSVILFTEGGYPSMPFSRSPGGVVSQHALQVSRPTPRGKFRGIWPEGVSRPTPKGEVEGDLARGVPRPTPRGVCSGGGVPGPGDVCGDPLGMATAAGGTHPTGMHSCDSNKLITKVIYKRTLRGLFNSSTRYVPLTSSNRMCMGGLCTNMKPLSSGYK